MRLHLHRATADNAGRFVDAGNDIDVGDEDEQIGADRAGEMIDGGSAIDPDAPEPDLLDLTAEQLAHDIGVERDAGEQ